MRVETGGWSGDGDFTIELLEVLEGIEEIEHIKVEDADASRTGSNFNFLANEIFLTFATERRAVRARWLGLIPLTRYHQAPRLTLAALEARLTLDAAIGPPDYSDEGMLQYLRTQRIVPPYQTRGYKLVEMVRLYSAPTGPAPGTHLE